MIDMAFRSKVYTLGGDNRQQHRTKMTLRLFTNALFDPNDKNLGRNEIVSRDL
jgi:hypothetical protein